MKSIRQHLQRIVWGTGLLIGLVCATGSYVLLSWLAEKDEQRHELALARQTELAVDRLLLPPTALLNLLANVPDLKSGRLADWMIRLPAQSSILRANPMLESVFVGGPNGEYLNLREIKHQGDRERFSVTGDTAWVVQAQRAQDMRETGQLRMSLDQQLNVLRSAVEPSAQDYDPRNRPWYIAALGADRVVRTEPYLFYSSGRLGITLARDMGNGFVVAMDINIASLSPSLKTLAQKTASRFWLFDHEQRLIAGDHPDEATDDLLAVVKTATATKPASGGMWIEDAQGEVWRLSHVPVRVDGYSDMELRYAVPRAVLLSKAKMVRDLLLGITAILLVVMLLFSKKIILGISRPLQDISAEADRFVKFDFTPQEIGTTSINEIELLSGSFDRMRDTIQRFMYFLKLIAREADLEKLLPMLLGIFVSIVESEAACLYLHENEGWLPKAQEGKFQESGWLERWLNGTGSKAEHQRMVNQHAMLASFIPLVGFRGEPLGVMIFERSAEFSITHERFAIALSDFAALVVESRALISSQKLLFDSFIKLTAYAVDAKSPHTGGHCHRVPVLTEWLVDLADTSSAPGVESFKLDDDLREAVHIGAWLHDCGKMATPEYVMDKATKLETIYDRIHEVRMRFEICKREAELAAWESAYPMGLTDEQQSRLAKEWDSIDDDFAFVAACNQGLERMSEEAVSKIHEISIRQWTKTIDDRLGLSQEELSRRGELTTYPLPVKERVLTDRPEHRIARPPGQAYEPDNPWGFKMQVPELLYDRGEIKNLTSARGTLTDEERYKINEHMVITIKMLASLPFPKHLASVPEIAVNHHERIDGRGYPRAIKAGDLSIPARLMAIADVFEALTASDRPYKTGKTVGQALVIMSEMASGGHLDSNLFALFGNSDVPRRYAEAFLPAWQHEGIPAAPLL